MTVPPVRAGEQATGEKASGEKAAGDKAAGAYRTIGELARDTGLPQHILRYWETRFPQLRPLQRAGNRRYYRPEDVALVERIATMLNRDGYTIRGVQQALAGGRKTAEAVPVSPASATGAAVRAVRDSLAAALVADSAR
ncbi:MerR family transcriptional regulator [Sphingomonas sp. 10B4]|uniref:MerR family transcriptional regulator n=1 Tax=Sphingomonas sp. 10B4 TaxID=3048575 RepID=UPI002AB51788|nr:MerR family transcriptional regulator [Sphingomonas sp. 10B4]MDY7523983.1 MerR family transcriptional regulator [Sphingomonas sp. 10B4]MEB0282501.1 MerR family transcriptional regulator [Sphingomonas sp. 10B4]